MSTLWSWVSPVSWYRWWYSVPAGAQSAAERSVVFSSLRRSRECGICLGEMRYPRLLDCLHAFCTDCLKKHHNAARRSNTSFCPALLTCPTCHDETIVHYADTITSLRNDVAFAMAELAFRASVQACMNEMFPEGETASQNASGSTQSYVRMGGSEELRVSIERAENDLKQASNEVYTFLDEAVDLHEEMRARAHELARNSEDRDREALLSTLQREFGASVEKMVVRDRDVFERYCNAKADRLLVELIARFYQTRLGDAPDEKDPVSASISRCFVNLDRFDAERVAPKAIYAAARYLLEFDTKHEARADAPLDDDAVRTIGELRNQRGHIINEALRRDAFYANAFLFRTGASGTTSADGDADATSQPVYSTVNKAGLARAGVVCTPVWRVGQRPPPPPTLSPGVAPPPAPLGTFEWCTHANFLDFTRAHTARGIVCDKMNSRLQLVDLATGTCVTSMLDGLVRPRRVVQLPDERVAICDEFGETLKLFDVRVAGGALTELGHTRSAGQPCITDEWDWPTGDKESEWKTGVNQSLQRTADGVFRCCAGLAVTTDGELACADADRGFLCTIDPSSGVVSTKFTTRFLDDRYVPHPYFVAVDSSDSITASRTDIPQVIEGNDDKVLEVESTNDVLITSDTHNSVVKLYSRRGRVINSIGGFRCARGLCTDSRGRLFVADADNHRIALHDANGKYIADALDASDGICYPMSVALNRRGDLLLLTQCGVYTRHKVTLVRVDEQFDARIDARRAPLDDDDESQLVERNPLLANREYGLIDVSSVEVK